jgi:hypothetical protein
VFKKDTPGSNFDLNDVHHIWDDVRFPNWLQHMLGSLRTVGADCLKTLTVELQFFLN